jgi:hypothetical protein
VLKLLTTIAGRRTDLFSFASVLIGVATLIVWLAGRTQISTIELLCVSSLGFLLGALRVTTGLGAIGVGLNGLSLLYIVFLFLISRSL